MRAVTPDDSDGPVVPADERDDWDSVLRFLSADWVHMYQHHPRMLLATLEAMPAHVLDQDMRLPGALEYLRCKLNHQGEAHACVTVLPNDPVAVPIDQLAIFTARITAAQCAGRHLEALTVTERAVAYLRAVPLEVIPTLSDALPELHYHWGMTFLQASRFSDALEQFSRSYSWASSIDHQMMMVSAGGGLAFLHAVHGRQREAVAWLARIPEFPAAAWWGSASPVAAQLATALLHLDQLDRDSATKALAEIKVTPSSDLWSPYFVLRASTTPGRKAAAQSLLSEFEAFVEAAPAEHMSVPLNAECAALTRYILLLKLHQPGRAAQEVNSDPVDENTSIVRQIGTTMYARRLLHLGQSVAARQLIAPLLNVSSAKPRILVPALLIAAETDRLNRSDDLRDRAIALAAWNVSFLDFSAAPPAIRNAVADRLESLDKSAIAARLRTIPHYEWVPGFDALTARESAVTLAAIAGLSNAEISESHQVSINTVKVQLRAAYRKLNVSTRRQLAELLELGN